MSAINPHLFVYGSLMSTARHPMGERLRREARLVGAATMQGRLYRVSWYPAAVAAEEPDQRVHGEVYALDDPASSLAWLDAYEGIAPGTGELAEYARIERPVRLVTGQEMAAWVYLYRQDVGRLALIADGRWRGEAG